ncbi:UDP-galactopyranose mutase [Streptomyces sp. M19]
MILREYSRFADRHDEPYYPINATSDQEKISRYRALAGVEYTSRNVFFGGRLGTYKYLDMHMAVSSALWAFEHRIAPMVEDYLSG